MQRSKWKTTWLVALFCMRCAAETDDVLFVEVADVHGGDIAEYAFVAAYDDGRVEQIFCSADEATAFLECTGQGVEVLAPTGVMEITVKAAGYGTFTGVFTVAGLRLSQGRRSARAVLARLAPFEITDDYTTGFEPDTGLQAFKSLAYQSVCELGPLYAVKFYMRDLDEEPKIYFMNTDKHRVHYAFVRDVLGIPLAQWEYESETYYEDDRTAMAGTLVYYPKVEAQSAALGDALQAPVALTFFPSDRLTPSHARKAYRLIEERLGFAPLQGGERRLAYLPAGSDQEAALDGELDLFRKAGALWVLKTELYGKATLQVLNEGEAYGTLRRMTPEALETEVVSYTDILVLTRLPNTLPVVGGTITEEIQTPLAHVNVASIARGTPNIALLNAGDDPQTNSLLGKPVHFIVDNDGYSLAETTAEQVVAFWQEQLKETTVLESDLSFWGLPDFDELTFEDSIRVGAKAANVAQLPAVIGHHAPYGFAVPFSYCHQFMETTAVTDLLCGLAQADCLGEGRDARVCAAAAGICREFGSQPETLSQYAERLMQRDDFASDSVLREALLDGLRHHMRTVEIDPDLAYHLNHKITAMFGGQKVRLRSSTNAEDLPGFSGAGLYSSVSAYGSGEVDLASLEIRKVWASVWNWRAFEERSFWNVDHSSVQMGVLVHQAFPDEAANGVLITKNLADPLTIGMYVNVQLGEIPVTNPLNGATPEIFSIVSSYTPGEVQTSRLAYSSLSPHAPILTDSEIEHLYLVASRIQEHFAALYGVYPWETAAFDLEFKFHGPNRELYVKQVRPFVGVNSHGL